VWQLDLLALQLAALVALAQDKELARLEPPERGLEPRLVPRLEPQLEPRLEQQLGPRLEPQLEPQLEMLLEPLLGAQAQRLERWGMGLSAALAVLAQRQEVLAL
jgi:hypothetical protein